MAARDKAQQTKTKAPLEEYRGKYEALLTFVGESLGGVYDVIRGSELADEKGRRGSADHWYVVKMTPQKNDSPKAPKEPKKRQS